MAIHHIHNLCNVWWLCINVHMCEMAVGLEDRMVIPTVSSFLVKVHMLRKTSNTNPSKYDLCKIMKIFQLTKFFFFHVYCNYY